MDLFKNSKNLKFESRKLSNQTNLIIMIDLFYFGNIKLTNVNSFE